VFDTVHGIDLSKLTAATASRQALSCASHFNNGDSKQSPVLLATFERFISEIDTVSSTERHKIVYVTLQEL